MAQMVEYLKKKKKDIPTGGFHPANDRLVSTEGIFVLNFTAEN
jgi:hypothetical protein